MNIHKNFGRRALSVLLCCRHVDDDEHRLLLIQKKKLGAHEIDILFDLVLTWSTNILESMKVIDGNPATLQAAREWFLKKVIAIKGIWWPEMYGIQYEIYSEAVRMSPHFLEILDEKSREDIMNWMNVSKEVTIKHLKLCLRLEKKKRSAFTSFFNGFSFEKVFCRLDKFFFKAKEDYEFFSVM